MKELNKELIEVKNKKSNIVKKIYNIFLKEDIKKENNFFVIATLIIYTLIICIACFYHEGWQDETQAWLIARDLSPLEIIKQMKYEGHSCLWHFMLLPFAKLGLPFDAIKIISIISAVITAYLVLKESPFNRITKVCILFSSTFLYYMPAIVRPYSLMPLLVTIISIMNKDKERYPISYGVVLALIANTHILMLPFAGMLFLYNYGSGFLKDRNKWNKTEKKKIYLGISIAIIGMLIITIFAVSGYFCSVVSTNEKLNTPLERADIGVLKFVYFLFGFQYMKYAYIIVITLLGLLLCHTILFSRKHGVVFWITFIAFIIVYLFVYEHILNQRVGMIFLFIYYYAWNYRFDIPEEFEKNKNLKLIFAKIPVLILILMFLMSIKNTYMVINNEIKTPYAGGKQIAQYIENNIEEESIFLCLNAELISPVIAYVESKDYTFYEIDSGLQFTYKTWDKFYKYKEENLENAIKKFKDKKLYILFKIEVKSLEEYLENYPGINEKSTLIYETEECNNGKFYLLKVNN